MSPKQAERMFHLVSDHEAATLYGLHDEHLKLIEAEFGVKILARGQELTVSGSEEAVAKVARLFEQLLAVVRSGRFLRRHEVVYAIRAMEAEHPPDLATIYMDKIEVLSKRQFITPKTVGQKEYVDAIRRYDIVFAIGPAGTGKCVAGSTLVLTGEGLIPIETLARGEMQPGDYLPIDLGVAGLHGEEEASHLYYGGHSQTKRIRTRLGFEIEVTPEHPLLKLHADGKIRWSPAQELKVGDHVAIQRGQQLFGRQIDVQFGYRRNSRWDHSRRISFDRLDEKSAYLLGILTGDGCLTFKNRVILSSGDPEILEGFHMFAQRLGLHVFQNGGGRPYDRIIASSQLYQLLLHLGLSDGPAVTKRVPRSILQAPEPLVIAFLQGLFDSDGTVNRRDGYPQLSSVSKRLIDEVQLLLLNLGILANKREKWTWYRDQRRLSYQLEMTGADAERFFEGVGFRLARKQALRLVRLPNTNVDVIPHIHGIIRSAISAGTYPRSIHKVFQDYKSGRRKPSYETLGEIVGVLEKSAAETEDSLALARLHAQRFFWAEIVEIGDGEADVYDLTVPGSHSFCANGFVSHNTYLAMAMAVNALKRQEVSRIILTRPAVEAGESLGFHPGTYEEKVAPYLRPLYDALYDMMDVDRIQRSLERGVLEVAPLAYMRGRTLNDSFVILDEAQNCTPEQMKMFLTRLGFDSKAVITGDITQSDLPLGKTPGLVQAREILKGIEGIQFIEFSGADVVRHELVQQIVAAYERNHEPR